MTYVRTMTASAPSRRGITLMEVLISIGILSIGLASVVALIPAGGSQAKKTVIEDRRGAMGAGAMADVVNYGMLNPATWSTTPTVPYRVVIDPIGNGSFPSSTGLTSVNVSNIAPGSLVANLVFSAADDLVYVDNPASDDPTAAPPIPKRTSDGVRRATEGAYTWLATITPSGTNSPSQFYTLSIVEFYRRPPSSVALSLTVPNVSGGSSSATLDLSSFGLDLENFRRLFPVGGALLFTNQTTVHAWRRIQVAAPTTVGGVVTAANIALDRDVPSGISHVYALEGTVGVFERGIQLEGTSPWTQ